MRSGLPDNASIKFTHADLHPTNIMLTPEGETPRVVTIIDWHQSGWYPDYWEFCKTRWTSEIGGEWVTKYVPKFVQPVSDEIYAPFDYFTLSLGM